MINGAVHGKRFPFYIHLGSKFSLSLEDSLVKDLGIHPKNTLSYLDIEGKSHDVPSFSLDHFSLGSFEYKGNEVMVVSDRLPSKTGCLGRPFLIQRNFLFDFNHSLMLISNSLKELKEDGYDIESYHKVPLEITPKGVFAWVETESRSYRLMINTGDPTTVLKGNSENDIRLEKFIIGGKDIGPMTIPSIPISDKLEGLDGFLGLDLFKNTVVYFDFSKRIMYLK